MSVGILRRYLFNAQTLDLDSFNLERMKEKKNSYHKKGQLLNRLGAQVNHGQYILTEDLAALLYLTEPDDDFDLVLKVVQRYQEFQEKAKLKIRFPLGIKMLQMLYIVEKEDLALKWFLNDKNTVNPMCRSRKCFLIMMDMLFECGLYEEVVNLILTCENFLDKKYPELMLLALAALYKMNTKESFQQMLTLVSELSKDSVQLTDRCALMCCMLAYQQGEIEVMLEMIKLPIFTVKQESFYTSHIINVKILAYIRLGRIEEAVGMVESIFGMYKNAFPVIFDDVINELTTQTKLAGNKLLDRKCAEITRSLKASGYAMKITTEQYLFNNISVKEYDFLCNNDIRESNILKVNDFKN
ncbi:uncharacterized protein LOC132719492 isoform X2 [Ruditapes philippinarum]|uniref:uncharacterized protein LOC132719492 isoform X2 n=1 Tax=Ruditapes philippinarum TaxID=129788 RepID=UPI00295B8D8E|nr:uncharacterized protein LOC132719492 isoform X2 [Ruditapes philippinarum]